MSFRHELRDAWDEGLTKQGLIPGRLVTICKNVNKELKQYPTWTGSALRPSTMKYHREHVELYCDFRDALKKNLGEKGWDFATDWQYKTPDEEKAIPLEFLDQTVMQSWLRPVSRLAWRRQIQYEVDKLPNDRLKALFLSSSRMGELEEAVKKSMDEVKQKYGAPKPRGLKKLFRRPNP